METSARKPVKWMERTILVLFVFNLLLVAFMGLSSGNEDKDVDMASVKQEGATSSSVPSLHH
jgi:hypothetical protein